MSPASLSEQVSALYTAVLNQGQSATACFYNGLRQHGIDPTMTMAGEFFASNPVLVPGHIVDWMTDALNRFVEARRRAVRDATDVLSMLPSDLRGDIASHEVASVIWHQLQSEPSLAALDAFLVETPDGLIPAYLEWHTVGTYATMAGWILRCEQAAWSSLANTSPTATRGWDLATLEQRSTTASCHRMALSRMLVWLRPEAWQAQAKASALSCGRLGAQPGDRIGTPMPREMHSQTHWSTIDLSRTWITQPERRRGAGQRRSSPYQPVTLQAPTRPTAKNGMTRRYWVDRPQPRPSRVALAARHRDMVRYGR